MIKSRRTEGVREIAKRFGVDPGTVQRISALSTTTASARSHEGLMVL